jgi:hypothetical protein
VLFSVGGEFTIQTIASPDFSASASLALTKPGWDRFGLSGRQGKLGLGSYEGDTEFGLSVVQNALEMS